MISQPAPALVPHPCPLMLWCIQQHEASNATPNLLTSRCDFNFKIGGPTGNSQVQNIGSPWKQKLEGYNCDRSDPKSVLALTYHE